MSCGGKACCKARQETRGHLQIDGARSSLLVKGATNALAVLPMASTLPPMGSTWPSG